MSDAAIILDIWLCFIGSLVGVRGGVGIAVGNVAVIGKWSDELRKEMNSSGFVADNKVVQELETCRQYLFVCSSVRNVL